MTTTDHRSTALAEHIRRIVDDAPQLSVAQRDRLVVLLRPVPAAPVRRAA